MIKKLSIVIPVYNEETYISKVAEKLLAVKFDQVFNEFEIIIVDDGSTDDTLLEIQTISNNFPAIKYHQLEINAGKGAAIQAGLKLATGNVFIVQDADLELVPDDIIKLGHLLFEKDLILVNGSRFMRNHRIHKNSGLRNLANKLFSVLATIINGKKITDITCGYKLFTRELYGKIEIREKGFGVEAELLTKALKFDKQRVMEYPVQYFPREISGGKKIRIMDGFRIIQACIKYKFVDK